VLGIALRDMVTEVDFEARSLGLVVGSEEGLRLSVILVDRVRVTVPVLEKGLVLGIALRERVTDPDLEKGFVLGIALRDMVTEVDFEARSLGLVVGSEEGLRLSVMVTDRVRVTDPDLEKGFVLGIALRDMVTEVDFEARSLGLVVGSEEGLRLSVMVTDRVRVTDPVLEKGLVLGIELRDMVTEVDFEARSLGLVVGSEEGLRVSVILVDRVRVTDTVLEKGLVLGIELRDMVTEVDFEAGFVLGIELRERVIDPVLEAGFVLGIGVRDTVIDTVRVIDILVDRVIVPVTERVTRYEVGRGVTEPVRDTVRETEPVPVIVLDLVKLIVPDLVA